MATVTSRTAASIDALFDDTVVSGAVASNGHLILTKAGGASVDAGIVVPAEPNLTTDNHTNGMDISAAAALDHKCYATKATGTSDMVISDGGAAVVLPKPGFWMATAGIQWDPQGTTGRRWMGYFLDEVSQPGIVESSARTGEYSFNQACWNFRANANQLFRVKASQTPDAFTDPLGFHFSLTLRWIGV